MSVIKKYSSDNKGYSFLLVIITLAVGTIVILLKYILNKIEIMYPNLFEQERTLPELIIYSVMAFFAAAYIIFALIFLRIWHRSLKYTLTDTAIVSDTGFFIKTHQVMKYSSVQYVSRISLPLSHINSFNFIIISALGGRLLLMFLSDPDADEITSIIRSEAASAQKEI